MGIYNNLAVQLYPAKDFSTRENVILSVESPLSKYLIDGIKLSYVMLTHLAQKPRQKYPPHQNIHVRPHAKQVLIFPRALPKPRANP